MNDLFVYLIIAVLFLSIGFIIGKLLIKSSLEKRITELETKNDLLIAEKEDKNNRIDELSNEKNKLNEEKHAIDVRFNQKIVELKNLETKLKEDKNEVEKLQEKFTKDFELLATKILDEKSSKFTEQNKENLKTILNPLQEKIQIFEKKVEDTHKESIDYHAALRQQIIGLKELNEQMSLEAINLTKALKGDSKAQGDWGETQLEILLEKAGLSKDIHFSTQGGYRDEDGNLKKPDFVINLPDNKHLIIDSKVSLTAYESYFNSEEESDKEAFLKKHLVSIKNHFKELGEKKYTDLYGINTPDYVLMFVPIEPALMLALNKDNRLYLEALDKNVVLVSTSTLLATLSTVSSIWKQEDQKTNVLEIARQAGRLYDQFVNLTDDFIKVGNQLNTVQGTYDSSMKKLTGKGNLIKKVEAIKKLGAKASKSINDKLLERAFEDED